MIVACRVVNCPLYNNGFCCSETILITGDGKCFDLMKGFTPEQSKQIKKTLKIPKIEDVETVEINKPKEEIKEESSVVLKQNNNTEVNDEQPNENQEEHDTM